MGTRNVNRNLSLLLGGQLISQSGDKFYDLALAVWILNTTKSPTVMGIFLFFALLPQVIVGLVAGGFIDRWNKKSILIATDIIRGILVVIVATAYYLNGLTITLLITIQVLLAVNTAFFAPTTQAVIPGIVERNELISANSKSQLITGIVTIAGPVLGAMVIAYFGYGPIFIFNAASFFASAVFECFLRLPVLKGFMNKLNLTQDVLEGYRYIMKRRSIVIVLVVVIIVHLFVGSTQVITPVFANKLPGIGAKNLGYLQTAYGLGAVLISILIGKNKSKINESKFLFIGIALIGIIYGVIGAVNWWGVNSVLPFLLLFAILGAALIIAGISFQVILQKNIEVQMGGRVFSVVNSARYLSIPFSSLVFGILLSKFPIYYIFLFAGLAVLPITFMLAKVYLGKDVILDRGVPGTLS